MAPRQLAENELLSRERDILDTAFEVVAEVGMAALTLERVSQNLPYSKGTLYNHFTCKEDLVVALCLASMETFEAMSKRAIAYDGSLRDRMQAILIAYMLYAKVYPIQFMLVVSAKSGQVIERASEARRAALLETETRLMAPTIEQLIQPAIESGECAPSLPLSAEQIVFFCWSNSFGAIALLQEDVASCTVRQFMSSEREVLVSSNLLLDGLRWAPLSADHDWRAQARRAATRLFADELALLEARGTPISFDEI